MPPTHNRLPAYLLLALSLAGLGGCASMADMASGDAAAAGAPVVTIPATPEGQVLGLLGSAASGERVALMDGVQATAGQTYAAASGRACRWVTLTYPAGSHSRRLACVVGGAWQWVATVNADLSR